MPKQPRSQAFLLLFAIALTATGCANVHPHRGDGDFANKSWFLGPVHIRGYSISMPTFDLGAPCEAKYQFSELTNIRENCGIYLAIERPADSTENAEQSERFRTLDTKKIDGFLKFELTNSSGETVTSTEGRLGDFTWAGGGNYELYRLDETFFMPDSDEEYTLHFSYLPDSQLNELRGFIYLRSGGRK